MEDDSEYQRLNVPSPEDLASVQVFPLILCIKHDVEVSLLTCFEFE